MLRFTINVAGETQMDKGIARFAEGLSDYRPIWPLVYANFLAEAKAQFASEGESGGEHWAPLSPEYARWKEAHYPGKPILERTGDLMRSLTEKDAPHAVFQSEPRKLTMGSDLIYALFHQTGTSKMSARKEVQLTKNFKRETMRDIQDFMVERATELGFRTGMKPTQAGKVSAAMAKYPGWSPYAAGGTA